MTPILFLDLETDKQNNIKDIGALFKENELHEKNTYKLERWIKEAEYICGHNIIKHDVPILKSKLGADLFEGKILIDTLLWSPLLFAERPYHKLVKGYQIINEYEVNNPLSDCKLTRQLLFEEIEQFKTLPETFKSALHTLVGHNDKFKGLFALAEYSAMDVESDAILESLVHHYCTSVDIRPYKVNHPEALAYVIAILSVADKDAICPYWVQYEYPMVQNILEDIRFSNCESPQCHYCQQNLSPQKALQHYFGYDDFRKFGDESISLQERTVRAGIQNQSFVAVFPTGGGKSLTFQLPALMKGALTRQLTVIVSPLVSLMKDQVDVLEGRFKITKGVAINGLLSPLERKEALERVADGSAHLLYISPESLRSPTIARLLQQRSIARFVIDEAHCFSSWGQDFRVDYLYIAEFIKSLDQHKRQPIPISCFTATAKPQVIEDIKTYFKSRLDIDFEEYITRAERSNLEYEVIGVENKEDKRQQLVALLNRCEKPAIIYASRVKSVVGLGELLTQAGFEATFFHGKLDKDVKVRNQEAFMTGKKNVIVATSAFGMGVDKDDVKTVIHYDISDSLENYVQEAGRAGRKEHIKAKCYILFHEDDLNAHFSLLQQTKINHKEVQQIWNAIKSLNKFRDSVSYSALEIAKAAGWDTEVRELENKVTASISALEDQGFLKRKQNSPRVFATSLLFRNLNKALTVVRGSSILTEKQKENCVRILQRLIKDEECRVDYLADILDLSLKAVNETLSHLRELELLGDQQDLTAFINLKKRARNYSQRILKDYLKVEKDLVDLLSENSVVCSMRQLNQNLINQGNESSSPSQLMTVLTYWDKRNFLEKKRKNRADELYELSFKDRPGLLKDIQVRHELAPYCFGYIEQRGNQIQVKDNEDVPVRFSLHALKKENTFFGNAEKHDLKSYERALLYLNHIKAIKLEGGFMVLYNKLNISEVKKGSEWRTFKVENYQKLKTFYEHKIQQIHIVGEYAKKQIESYKESILFVNDYFTMDFDDFKEKYFFRRGKEISRAITKTKYLEFIGNLDPDQNKIIERKTGNILVLAGPGSGKTRVLVNKIASLLLLEDIKPEQFLMLTFSKAAAMEFKSRVYDLIPEYARLIKIATFHGYCFQLLGQLGDIEKSENIIPKCIEAIEKEEIDITSIMNKSVLLLDEFQDVSADEWQLIKTIEKKVKQIRIIAVGDDDQNIYGFRQSDNKYMAEFRDNYKVTVFDLLKNYRSREGIIQFNNRLLQEVKSRLKNQHLVAPKRTLKAKIKVTQYGSNHIISPIVDDIEKTDFKGTSALLVRTNKQALLAITLLRDRGIKARLVTGLDGFRLSQLAEIHEFDTHLMKSKDMVGIIYKEQWQNAREWFNQHYQSSIHFYECNQIFNLFESSHDVYEVAEWHDFIRQVKTEDAIHPCKDTVIVTTMHKTKGKEFDHVFVMMEDFNIYENEEMRLLYVACSRAKERLHVHVNSNFFREWQLNDVNYVVYDQPTEPPQQFDLVLSLKDIYLDIPKKAEFKAVIHQLTSGEALSKGMVMNGNFMNEGIVVKETNQGLVIFSRGFNGKLAEFKQEGYLFNEARAEYLVYWFDPKEKKEYKVVLPKLRFLRK